MTTFLSRAAQSLGNSYRQGAAAIERWVNPTHRPILKLAVGTVVSFTMTVVPVEVAIGLSAANAAKPVWLMLLLICLWLGSYVVSFLFIMKTAVKACRGENLPKQTHLRLILASYMSLIVCFTGIYYSMATVTEYNDAVAKFHYYKAGIYGDYRKKSERAFGGMSHQRWRDIEYHAAQKWHLDLQEIDPAEIPVEELRQAAREAEEFHTDGDLFGGVMVLVDCFHFSTVTITTLGYGDITPKVWYSKLAADLEVITGIFIAAVSIGAFFSRKDEMVSHPLDDDPGRLLPPSGGEPS